MTLSKALSVLKLNKNYSKEELKKRYRELAKKYHPDHHMNKSIEEQEEYNRKTKEINEAYEKLTEHIEKRMKKNIRKKQETTKTAKETEIKLSKEKNESINIIKNYYKECSEKELKKIVKKLIDNYTIKIINNNDINKTVSNFIKELKKIYQDYILEYSKKHHIPLFIIKRKNFEYDCDCYNFLKQLEQCENIIIFEITKIIRKYKNNIYFKVLEKTILEETKKFRESININTTEEEYLKLLEEYNLKINQIIINYSKKIVDFKYTLDRISKQLDNKTKSFLYKNIKEIVLEYTEEEIVQMLKEAIERKNKENKEAISQKLRELIYQGLREKYLNASKFYINHELISKLFLIATEILYNENCTKGIAAEINHITFKVPKEEYERLIRLSRKHFDDGYDKRNDSMTK